VTDLIRMTAAEMADALDDEEPQEGDVVDPAPLRPTRHR
jgi:hypothetical protein